MTLLQSSVTLGAIWLDGLEAVPIANALPGLRYR